jgi:hypothetical protein
LRELFELFGIMAYPITADHLKMAKKKVLQSHPDKSNLPSEYFLFYKQAYELIVSCYDAQNKVSQNTVDKKEYSPIQINPNIAESHIQKNISDINPKQFQDTFNRLFEENMVEKLDPNRNSWFTSEESVFDTNSVKSVSQMNTAIDQIKQRNQAMSVYKGVVPLRFGNGSGSSFYDDDGNEDPSQTGEYISSDIFGKLKYDDLRKVHKDQTVFSVRENDIDKIPKFQSVDQYVRARDQGGYVPMEKTQAEQMLAQQEKQLQEIMLQKQHAAELRNMAYSEKNKNVLSSFLRLN